MGNSYSICKGCQNNGFQIVSSGIIVTFAPAQMGRLILAFILFENNICLFFENIRNMSLLSTGVCIIVFGKITLEDVL